MAENPTRIEILRAKAGLSQEDLALAAGVSREVISAIETRQPGRRVRTVTLAKLAGPLGVELEELLMKAEGAP